MGGGGERLPRTPGLIVYKTIHLCLANIGNRKLPPNLLKYVEKDPDILSNSSDKNEFKKKIEGLVKCTTK